MVAAVNAGTQNTLDDRLRISKGLACSQSHRCTRITYLLRSTVPTYSWVWSGLPDRVSSIIEAGRCLSASDDQLLNAGVVVRNNILQNDSESNAYVEHVEPLSIMLR